jgi:FAD dependent oxidoreductase TIGR03364
MHADVAVVGGGIVGLAFARAAARRGKSVVLFERSAAAAGASVRNFGMIWPIGQPPGPLHRLALRSRDLWRKVARDAGIWLGECGSVHAAYEDDERDVVAEFAGAAPALGVACEFLAAKEAIERFPALNPNGLCGVLYSPTECAIDPREAVARLPHWLAEAHGVTLRYGVAVTAIDMPRVRSAGGEVWTAGRVFVCSGADFETLFPDVFAAAGLTRVKLQMMRTAPQPGGWRLGPHVAGGLTLAHYKSFELCRALAPLKARLAGQYPEHLRYGIHVMAAQNRLGEVVIGDSHEPVGAATPFDNPRIDGLILAYLWKLLRLPSWDAAARWHGVYAKHPTRPVVTAEPQPGCAAVTGAGGAGMTLAFGLAEAWWEAFEAGKAFDPTACS